MGTVLCLNSGNSVDEVLRYCHMIDEFMELMTDPDEEAFYEMEIGDFLELEDVLDRSAMDSYESEYSKESRKKKIYGYDELVPVVVEIEIDGEDYIFMMSVARYGGEWYNLTVSVGLLNAGISDEPVDAYTGFYES